MAYLSCLMNNINRYRYAVHLAIWMALVGLYVFPALRVNWNSTFGLRYTLVRYFVYGFINFNLFYLLVFHVLTPYAMRKKGLAAALVAATVIGFCGIKYAVGLIWPDEVLQRAIAARYT